MTTLDLNKGNDLELTQEELQALAKHETIDPELKKATGLLRFDMLDHLSRITEDPVLKNAATKMTAKLNAIHSGDTEKYEYDKVA